MALNPAQLNQITTLANVCKALQAVEADIEDIDVLFNGDTNWAALVTQEAVDAIPSFSQAGLTADSILGAIYLVKTAKAAWRANLPAFVSLANL